MADAPEVPVTEKVRYVAISAVSEDFVFLLDDAGDVWMMYQNQESSAENKWEYEKCVAEEY